MRPVILILLLLMGRAVLADIQPLTEIRDTAKAYFETEIRKNYADANITIGDLDTRLRLPRCGTALKGFSPHSVNVLKSGTVGVKCTSPKPWSIYVPVSVEIYREVAVANKPLARGRIVTAADIAMQRFDISKLSGSYLFHTADIVGRELTRPVQMGKPLFSHLLKDPIAIHRGQTVPLVARGKDFEVRMEGLALSDAAVGQRLKVRNIRSRRIVEGQLAKNGTVFVN